MFNDCVDYLLEKTTKYLIGEIDYKNQIVLVIQNGMNQ